MLLIGAGWSYFVALAAGPQPGVLYVFLAAMASWICVFSWLWIAAPHAGELADRLVRRVSVSASDRRLVLGPADIGRRRGKFAIVFDLHGANAESE